MYLSYISDENLIAATKRVIDKIDKARNAPEQVIFKNTIDPFSGLFDSTMQKISIKEWLEQERSRQVQKSFQNTIGEFHQSIIGSMPGWENLGVGSLVDVKNKNLKIVAEIKNKYNTTKGNHRVAVYDDLNSCLKKPEYSNFTAYFVEILPKSKKSYDKEFTPPDNKIKKTRPANKKIRLISGQLFYDLAAGEKDSLRKLFIVLPKVISGITGVPIDRITDGYPITYLFDKAY